MDPAASASQTSSHFQLEPVQASVLAAREKQRRNEVAQLGRCRTGCAAIDDEVLLGGFERGCVVGISAEDEEMSLLLGLQTLAHGLCEDKDAKAVRRGLIVTPKPAASVLMALRGAVLAELEARGEQEKDAVARACLERVMLSCVFDLDGLWEVLADLDRPAAGSPEQSRMKHGETKERIEAKPEEHSEEEPQVRREEVELEAEREIQDSQDDDEELLASPEEGRQPSSPSSQVHQRLQVQEPDQEKPQTSPPSSPDNLPAIILVTHFSALLTILFTQREKKAAHSALQLLGGHLRDVSRNLSPTRPPLIMLLNSATSAAALSNSASAAAPTDAAGAGAAEATASPAARAPLDPTLRSVFTAPAATAPGKPSFGLVFSQLLDLHMLCTRVPRTRDDAETLAGARGHRQHHAPPAAPVVGMAWIVEVLLDEMGVWEGRLGPRASREQRFTAVQTVNGRVVEAFSTTGRDTKVKNTTEVRVAGGFGGRQV